MAYDIVTTVFVGIFLVGTSFFSIMNYQDGDSMRGTASAAMTAVFVLTIVSLWVPAVALQIVTTVLIGLSMLLGSILCVENFGDREEERAVTNIFVGCVCVLAIIRLWA